MLYLYAITDVCGTVAILPSGVSDIVPEVLPFEGFSVVAARLRDAPARDEAAARGHMAVLTALMPHGTVLPARFGIMFDTRDQLDRTIAAMRDAVLADLQRLSGCVELGLSVTCHDAEATPAETPPLPACGPGTRYIAAKWAETARRAALERANEALAARLCATDGPLARLALQTVWRPASHPPAFGAMLSPAVSIALLIRAEHLDVFRTAIARLRSTETHTEFLCTGPWPPFSFVSAQSLPSTGRKSHDEPAFGLHS